MTRADLIDRIEALSDDDLAEVGPYLSADLDVIPELDNLQNEVALGRQSAIAEPLVDDAEVVRTIAARLCRTKPSEHNRSRFPESPA